MDLESFIYKFNLVSTLTIIDTDELICVLNKKMEKSVDYSNSINIYDIVNTFNQFYLCFKNDYDKLVKLDLGKDIEILRFYNINGVRNLLLYIDNPNKDICNLDEVLLYLYEKDEQIYSYITNGLDFWEDGYYRKDIDLNIDYVRTYLDFCEKYNSLLDSYNYLKNKCVFGNGCTMLFSKVNGNLLDNLTTFEISFGNVYFNSSDYVNVVFNISEKIDIDYESSIVKLNSVLCDDKENIINELIYKLFINKDKLPSMYYDYKYKKLTHSYKVCEH